MGHSVFRSSSLLQLRFRVLRVGQTFTSRCVTSRLLARDPILRTGGWSQNNILQGVQNDVRCFSSSTTLNNNDGGSSSFLKPWKSPMVESHGDYRDEAFLEEHIGGPLYEHQKDLPRLPIPTIEETMKRFLPTALPLVKSDEEKKALLAACDAFPEQAKVLQERLIHRRDHEMKDSSWLQLWWNQVSTTS